MGPSLQSRPTVLKKILLPSAAITILFAEPEEMAHSPCAAFGPPDPFDSRRMGPSVTVTLYVLLPTWSPVALPLKVQLVTPAVVGQAFVPPVPVPMTRQSSTRGAAVAAGATVVAGAPARASPAPSTTTKANSDFTERNVIDISPLLGPSGPLPFAEQNFSDHQSKGIGRFNGIHPPIEYVTASFDSGLWVKEVSV